MKMMKKMTRKVSTTAMIMIEGQCLSSEMADDHVPTEVKHYIVFQLNNFTL